MTFSTAEPRRKSCLSFQRYTSSAILVPLAWQGTRGHAHRQHAWLHQLMCCVARQCTAGSIAKSREPHPHTTAQAPENNRPPKHGNHAVSHHSRQPAARPLRATTHMHAHTQAPPSRAAPTSRHDEGEASATEEKTPEKLLSSPHTARTHSRAWGRPTAYCSGGPGGQTPAPREASNWPPPPRACSASRQALLQLCCRLPHLTRGCIQVLAHHIRLPSAHYFDLPQ